MAILFFSDGVRIIGKEDVNIANDGKQMLSDKIKVRAQFGEVTYRGTADRNSLQALVEAMIIMIYRSTY
jgi:phytoene/squalene synthetase